MQKNRDNIMWDLNWPMLSPLHLSYLELVRDPYYSFIPTDELESYLQEAIRIGEKAALPYVKMDLLSFFNHILKANIRIHIRNNHPEQSFIRAQYHKNKQTIFIYKNSIQEI